MRRGLDAERDSFLSTDASEYGDRVLALPLDGDGDRDSEGILMLMLKNYQSRFQLNIKESLKLDARLQKLKCSAYVIYQTLTAATDKDIKA